MEKIPPGQQGNDPRQPDVTQTSFSAHNNAPGQTAQTGFPGQASLPTGQTGFPGQTYPPGPIGSSGQPATTGPTSFPGQGISPPGGGQLQNQPLGTGQTGQTGYGATYPCAECVQAGQPDLDAIYRTGNFGKKYGKVNTDRGKKRVVLHVVLTCLMIVLTALAMQRMRYFSDDASYKKYLVVLPCLCCLSDVIACICAGIFMWRLSNLSNPYRFYMIFRCVVIVDMCLNINFIIVGALSALLYEDYFTVSLDIRAPLAAATRAIYAFTTLLMFVKSFVAYSFVSEWWSTGVCSCCAPVCIMEESSGLAPGIENPPPLMQVQNTAANRGVQTQEINRV